jgi:hypothetical protein
MADDNCLRAEDCSGHVKSGFDSVGDSATADSAWLARVDFGCAELASFYVHRILVDFRDTPVHTDNRLLRSGKLRQWMPFFAQIHGTGLTVF